MTRHVPEPTPGVDEGEIIKPRLLTEHIEAVSVPDALLDMSGELLYKWRNKYWYGPHIRTDRRACCMY